MARNILVINVDLRETRVALIEAGVIAELTIERASARGTVGNIVRGKVSRVLPGMQAAFIDVGLERAAFLHVEDLIRPDDFEAYLAGEAKEDSDFVSSEERGKRTRPVEGDEDDEGDSDDPPDPSATERADAEGPEAAVSEEAAESPGEGDGPDDDSETAEAEAQGLAEDGAQASGAGGAPMKMPPSRAAAKQPQRRRRRSGQARSLRVARSVPITEVVKEGDEVIVQISKEPIGTKGARVTSHVSLAGRYVVYLPTVDQIGISKRIGSQRERQRLRVALEGLAPEKGGIIVRTVAEGLTKKKLKADIGYLIKVWQEIAKRSETAKVKETLYSELDLVLRTARDLFSDDIEQIIIDDDKEYQRLVRFMEQFMPERAKDVLLYSGDEPIFDAYGIEDEIARALSRKVPLSSGGYLIIDQAEALTAIDVNTGRYVGKGSRDLEETALKTNLEAVDEIAYQLRFRNIGGLVILDLIDMEKRGNRDNVLRALEKVLAKDKAKTTLQRISELGLVEMTRKRTRESLGRLLHEQCFYCDGTGQIQSRETIAFQILRQIRREKQTLAGYSVNVNAHPAIVDLLKTDEKIAVEETERRVMRRIEFTPRREYHIEQFDLTGN